MQAVTVFNRSLKKMENEPIYFAKILSFLYGGSLFSLPILFLISRYSFCSAFFGLLQKSKFSRRKIGPFIARFQIDANEFVKKEFSSFNDFFIRELKKTARPLAKEGAVLPCDGKFLVFPQIKEADGFAVKGKKFSLSSLLKDAKLAKRYENGSMLIARLAPFDYHRFHFPFDCIPGVPRLINGAYFSVNPVAIRQNIAIFTQNKRILTELASQEYGKVLCVEVGATNVGSIIETFTPGKKYLRGEEKGYFAFGGSSLILLFEPGKIRFCDDLIERSLNKIESKDRMGALLGRLT